jgi:hypothetical protein
MLRSTLSREVTEKVWYAKKGTQAPALMPDSVLDEWRQIFVIKDINRFLIMINFTNEL